MDGRSSAQRTITRRLRLVGGRRHDGIHSLHQPHTVAGECRGRLAARHKYNNAGKNWRHTGDVWRYGLRLLVTAVAAEAPYDKIVTGRWWDWSVMNPIFGLLIALVVLTLLDWARRRYAGVVRGVPALSQ